MKALALFLILSVFVGGCASHFEHYPLTHWQVKAGEISRISVFCRGKVPDWFAHRLLVSIGQKAGLALVETGGDLHFSITIEPLERDFTPMFFVLPMAVAFFGCPQGGITGRYSVRISERASGRILAIWEGQETRVFGLYRLIPRVERDVYEAMLLHLTERIHALLQIP